MDGLNKQISGLSLEIESLKETINEMRQKVKDVELCRHEASFTFQIDDAKAFIESSELRQSEVFYCRGIAWYLTACTTRVNGRPESLSIYLNHNQPIYLNHNRWTMETSFSITLLGGTVFGKGEKTKKRFFDVFSGATTRLGFKKFTSVEKLNSRGFLKDNKLKVHVELHAKKLHSLFGL